MPRCPGAYSDGVTATAPTEDVTEQVTLAGPWVTIVWNDPVNLMDYVAWVFRSYFGHPAEEAERLMLLVHHEGRAVVATGPREAAERDALAMHTYGLWATAAPADL